MNKLLSLLLVASTVSADEAKKVEEYKKVFENGSRKCDAGCGVMQGRAT